MKKYAAHTSKGKVATHKNAFPKRTPTKNRFPKRLAPVTSLGDLRYQAERSVRHLRWAIVAAENLGGQVRRLRAAALPGDTDYEVALNDAMWVLNLNANETDERGVVAEVNFVRDLVE